MFSSAFESTLQKLVQMIGACGLTLLVQSLSARSGESSIPASSTMPLNLRDTLATFRQTRHQGSSLSIGDLSLEPFREQQLTLVQDDSAGR